MSENSKPTFNLGEVKITEVDLDELFEDELVSIIEGYAFDAPLAVTY